MTEILPEEIVLLNHLRSIGFGQCVVFVQNGKPIRIEESVKSILITIDKGK